MLRPTAVERASQLFDDDTRSIDALHVEMDGLFLADSDLCRLSAVEKLTSDAFGSKGPFAAIHAVRQQLSIATERTPEVLPMKSAALVAISADRYLKIYSDAFKTWRWLVTSASSTASGVKPWVAPEITDEHGKLYREQGFLVIEDAVSTDEIANLRNEAVQICRGERGEVRGLELALPDESDADTLSRYLCIHFPHKISQVVYDVLFQSVIVEALKRAIGPNIKCMQSMLFIKASGKPGQAWHQDEFFIPTRDRSLTGVSIAIDDATVENGCLWVIPGSHKHGILWPQRAHNDARFDCAGEVYQHPYSDHDAVSVEMRAGSVLLFNGYLMHRSLPNRAESGYRRSLSNHYMSAESFLPWHAPKESQVGIGRLDFRDVVMIAGRDPYGYKGVEDVNKPHIRPSGEGGCGTEYRNIGLNAPIGRK